MKHTWGPREKTVPVYYHIHSWSLARLRPKSMNGKDIKLIEDRMENIFVTQE